MPNRQRIPHIHQTLAELPVNNTSSVTLASFGPVLYFCAAAFMHDESGLVKEVVMIACDVFFHRRTSISCLFGTTAAWHKVCAKELSFPLLVVIWILVEILILAV